jgi:YihY family inner membrane protein
MQIINQAISKLDAFQRKSKFFGFMVGVIKKHNDDHMGHQAALLTYYAFLALFPLLLVLTTVAGVLAANNPEIRETVVTGMTSYFPVLGSQLESHVHGLQKTGFALVAGLLITFYGARGVADAFRNGVNHIWGVPPSKRDGFWKGMAKNFAVIVLGGLGLLTASLTATMVASVGSGIEYKLLSVGLNLVVLFWSFIIILNLSLPRHVTVAEVRLGAATAAFGLVSLQALGGVLLAKHFKNLDALYSNFALTLGLLFWLYLQAQVVYFAVEVSLVRSKKAWPRSLNGDNPTQADKLLEKTI